MWIRLDCPSGHPVKVDAKFAGKMGRCPACGATVKIPRIENQDLTESQVLELLGMAAAPTAQKAAVAEPQAESALDEPARAGSSGGLSGGSMIGQATRICPSCRRKVSVRYQICPHCRTYLPMSDLSDVSGIGTRGVTLNCPHCGVPSFPGATACGNCGEPLR